MKSSRKEDRLDPNSTKLSKNRGIILLSENYASSRWCLDELLRIRDSCSSKNDSKVRRHSNIYPVFYHVDPSNVRHQNGRFGEGFAKAASKHGEEKAEKWREALKEVADLSGWVYPSDQYRFESKFIQELVSKICSEGEGIYANVIEDLVGIHSRVEKVIQLLGLGLNDHARAMGIWGMGSVGKTTIAREVFRRIYYQFDAVSYLENVREVSRRSGLATLQQQLISDILGPKDLDIRNTFTGAGMIRNRVCNKKVLIVLDDVDQVEQLENLVGKLDRFNVRSRIIITTRDKHLLAAYDDGIDMYDDGIDIYKVEMLDKDESMKLFISKAFGNKEQQTKAFEDLVKRAAEYAGGVPLALKVLGSSLKGKKESEWKSALNRLKEWPDNKVLEALKISYDALDELEQKIFLDIACFLKRENKTRATQILDCFGFYAEIGMSNLVDKSLISFKNDNVWMHDLIQELGRNIVRKESKYPGERSRLWLYDDVRRVLRDNTGTKAVECIVLQRFEKEELLNIGAEAFAKMTELRWLEIRNVKLSLPNGLKYLPNGLKYLNWNGYPLKCFPQTFQLEHLVELHLINSCLEQLWDGEVLLPNLRITKFCNLTNLTKCPDFTAAPELEKLAIVNCESLVDVHHSVGVLTKLDRLDIVGCRNIRSLPTSMGSESLVYLELGDGKRNSSGKSEWVDDLTEELGCDFILEKSSYLGEDDSEYHFDNDVYSIKMINTGTKAEKKELLNMGAEAFAKMTGLKFLKICNVQLPNGLEYLSNELMYLNWDGCHLKCFPKTFRPEHLVELHLSNSCVEQLWDGKLPLPNLTEMHLINLTNLTNCPDVTGAAELKSLVIEDCKSLVDVHQSVGDLTKLYELSVTGCRNLRSLPTSMHCKSLWALKIREDPIPFGRPKRINILEFSENMKSLKTLQLQLTGIIELPLSVGHLKNLDYLGLTDCQCLESLPDSICQLKALNGIYLVNCQNLEILPDSICQLKALGRLYLSHCPNLRSLPDSICQLKALYILNLSHCQNLRSLPDSICQLNALRSLGLVGCSNLEKLPSSSGAHLMEVRSLYMNGCKKITSDSLNSFFSFSLSRKRLNYLDMGECNLESVPAAICSFCSLESLILNGNDFERLPAGMNQLTGLSFLYLEGCKRLEELPELPPRLNWIEAYDCQSLRTILSPSTYQYFHDFDFSNCIRLLGNEQILDVLLSTASQFCRRTDRNPPPTTEIRFPGSEIPKWFSRDKVELQSTNGRSLGYAACAVVEIKETCEHPSLGRGFIAAQLNIGDRLFNDLYSSTGQWRPMDTETLCITFGVLHLSKDELDRLNELGGPEFATFRIKSMRPGFKIKSCGLCLWIQEVHFIDPYNDDFDTASMRERKRLYNVDDDDDDPVKVEVDFDGNGDLVWAPPRNPGNNKKLRQLFEPKAMDLDLNEEETVGVVTTSIPKRRRLDNVDDDDDEEEEERHPNNKKPRFEPKAMDLDLNEEETVGPSRSRSLEEKEEDPSMDPQPRI